MDLPSLLSCKRQITIYLCRALVCNSHARGKQLKGNQVKVLNSPAAVSSFFGCEQSTL